MKKKWFVFVLVMLTGCLLIALTYQKPLTEEPTRVVTVDLLKDTQGTYNDHSLILSALGISNLKTIEETLGATSRLSKNRKYGVVKLPDTLTAIDVYQNYPEYAPYFEIDYYVQTGEVEPSNPNYTIEDPLYINQNEYPYVNIGDTWNQTLGQGITVAVIDTGIDTDHPEFAGKISLESYNASDDLVGIEYIEDEYGHGTSVAGTIAASFDSLGVVGIAPQVTLLVIKCEVDENGNFLAASDLVFGIYYAIEKGADVINMSFGITAMNPFAEVLQLAADSDIIPVAAAGNESTSAPTYPAADINAIGVGALANNSFDLAIYSNYGENTLLVAPGTVYTTKINGEYDIANGTSFAAPIVSGAVALYLSLNPNTPYEDIVDLLEASSADLGQPGKDWYYGFGALDVDALVCQEKGYVTFDYLTSEIDNTSHVFVVGRPLQEYPEPERSMLVYDGWYFDIQKTNEIEYFVSSFTTNLTVYASWINEDEGIPYLYSYLPDGSIQIDQYYGKMRYLVIPNEIEGKLVTSIGIGAFQNNQRIRQITLPDNLLYINAHAFQGANRLLEIKIPSSVLSIGDYAFYGNYRMGTVIIEQDSQLKSIGDFAFSQDVNLQRFDIPSDTQFFNGSVFYGCVSIREFNVDSSNPYFESIDSIIYDDTIQYVIANPAALTASVVIPSTVNTIKEFAFGYSKRYSVTLPEGLVEIKKYAFSFSSRLSSITIPSTVISIENNAFQNNTVLQEVTFLPNSSLVSIGEYAFAYTSSLQSITIPSSVSFLGNYAFFSATSISSVVFETGSLVTVIGDSVFNTNLSLTDIQLPENITSIGDNAFYQAIRLPNISLPNTVTSIGKYAFSHTWTMCSFIASDNLIIIDDYAFSYSGINLTYIGDSVGYVGEGVFGGAENLTSVLVSAENTNYKTIDGVLYSSDEKTLVAYPMGLSTNPIIPSGVEIIGAGAFYGNTELVNVTFPNTVTHINDNAFYFNTTLNNITLPSSLQFIGLQAFSVNSSLSQIIIPSSVNSIGRLAFNSDWELNTITFESNSSLNRIGFAAFAGTGVTSLSIPSSVTEIAQGAFANSINLTSVIFEENSMLTYIAADIFTNSPVLSSIQFLSGSQLLTIQAHAFDGLNKISSIDLSNATLLKEIGNYAFFGCSSLTEVILPNSLEYIGRFAFSYNNLLSTITIPENVSFIGKYAFYSTNSIFVSFEASYLPLGLDELWNQGIGGYLVNIQSRVVTEEYDYAILGDGFITLIKYLGSEEHLILNEIEGIQITSIQPGAFKNNQSIKTVVLPDSLAVVPSELFKDCTNLTSVTLGSKIVEIMNSAFENTSSLSSISIPSTVTEIGKHAFASSGLTSISFEIGSVLNKIDDYAFAQSSLSTIALPDDLSYIGSYAFYRVLSLGSISFNTGCLLQIRDYAFFESGLVSLSIPANVEYIGEFAFTANRLMSSITVDALNPYYSSLEGVLYNKDYSRLITYPAGKSGVFTVPDSVKILGYSAFEGSKYLTGVVFSPNNKIMSIGLKAFYGCEGLTEINLPNDIIHIGYYAFANNTSLQTFNISEKSQLTSVMDGAFYNDQQLSSIILPVNILEIGAHAFENTYSLTQLPYHETSQIVGIYEYAFANSGITSLVFPATLKDIGSHAFDNAQVGQMITLLDVPISVENIGYAAFANFSTLESVKLPFIGSDKFGLESNRFVYIFGSTNDLPVNLHEVSFYEGISFVPAHAFDWTMQIEKVTLPDSVIEINEYAFCVAGLKEIRLSSNLRIIEQNAFYNFQGNEIFIPSSVSYVGPYAFYGSFDMTIYIESNQVPPTWHSFWNYKDENYKNEPIYYQVISGHNQELITLENGYTISINNDETATIMKYSGTDIDIVIPEAMLDHIVTNIAPYAFVSINENNVISDNTTIKSITVPDTVKYIGAYAFSNLKALETIHLSNSLKVIETGLFKDSTGLKTVTIPEGVETIKAYSLYNCYLDELILPSTLIDIDNFALSNVNLNEIIIPRNVEHIGNYALSAVNRIYFQNIALPPYIATIWKNSTANVVFGVSFNQVEGDYRYMLLSDDTVIITEYLGGSSNIIMPDTIGGYPVTQLIDSLFMYNHTIEHVTLPANVKVLPPSLFQGASNLKTVSLPNGLIEIGNSAFLSTALTEISFPETLQIIGSSALQSTHNINTLTIPNSVTSIGSTAFADMRNLSSVTLPNNLTTIESTLFYGDSNLKSIVIPSSVTTIKMQAFASSGIESIEIPETIKVVGENILLNTPLYNNSPDGEFIVNNILLKIKGLLPYNSTLTISEDIRIIADNAFGEQPQLTELYIPETVEYIGSNLCTNCHSLKKVTIPYIRINLEYGKFISANESSIKEIVILPGATEIPNYAFSGYTDLEYITIPDSVIYVGSFAFHECGKLSRIEFLNPSITVDQYALLDCIGIREMIFPSSNIFGLSVVFGHSYGIPASLETVILTNGATSLNYGYLSDASSLNKVVIPASITSIDSDAFYNSFNVTLYFEILSAAWTGGELDLPAKWFGHWSYVTLMQNNQTISKSPIGHGDVLTLIDNPVQNTTDQYSYQFIGWDSNNDGIADSVPSTIGGPLTLKAVYQETINNVTINFYKEDGVTLIQSITVPYGTSVSGPMPPTKNPTEEFSYVFLYWSNPIDPVIGNYNTYPVYQAVINQYTYQFFDYEGNVIARGTINYGEAITIPDYPTMPSTAEYSYTFSNWDLSVPETITSNIDFHPVYSLISNQYQLTIDYLDGSNVETQTVDYESLIPIPGLMMRIGYSFGGWYYDIECTMAINSYLMPANNLTVYAQWIPGTYRLDFIDGISSEIIYSASYDYDADLSQFIINNPIKTGYTFTGWSNSIPLNMPAEDVTIQAIYEINSYSLTYKDYDNSILFTQSFTYHSELSGIDVDDPVRAGYSFSGWNKSLPETMPAEDYVIIATYQVNDYLLSYSINGDTPDTSIYYSFDSEIILVDNPVKTGHTFAGWYLDSEFNTAFDLNKMPSFDITLYAKWNVNLYQLSFIDIYNTLITSFSYYYGETINGITVDASVIEGYHFSSWSIDIPTTMPANNVTIKAIYDKNSFSIDFVTNGGNTIESQTYPYHDLLNLPFSTGKLGYLFTGWYEDINLTTKFNDINMPATNLTLYAKWTINSYLITFFDANNAIISTQSVDYHGDLSTLAVNPPSLLGYDFIGWDLEIPESMPAGNLEFRPVYHPIKYNLIYQNPDESIIYMSEIDYGTSLDNIVVNNPSKTGYTFTGWSLTLPDNMPAYDLIIEAVYQINQYSVIFKDWNGSIIFDNLFNYQSSLSSISVDEPMRTGYTFTNWSMDLPSIMTANDIIIEAEYQINQYSLIYKDYDGYVLFEDLFEYQSSLGEVNMSNPSRTGYTFTGWSMDLPANMPANNLVLEAFYTINHYTLTYLDIDGNILYSNEFEYNTVLPEINVTEPSITGYTFVGWDHELPTTMPAENLVIEAIYNRNKYKLTYLDSDGTILFTQDFDYNANLSELSIAEPIKIGYTFTGWSVTLPNKMPANDLILEAKYQINLYTITFLDRDGKTVIEQDLLFYGDTIQIPDISMSYETSTHFIIFENWSPYLPQTATENQTFTPIYQEVIKLSLEVANQIANQFETVSLKDYAALKMALIDLSVFAEYYPEQMNKVRMAVDAYKALVADAAQALEKSNQVDNHIIVQIVTLVRSTDHAIIIKKGENL